MFRALDSHSFGVAGLLLQQEATLSNVRDYDKNTVWSLIPSRHFSSEHAFLSSAGNQSHNRMHATSENDIYRQLVRKNASKWAEDDFDESDLSSPSRTHQTLSWETTLGLKNAIASTSFVSDDSSSSSQVSDQKEAIDEDEKETRTKTSPQNSGKKQKKKKNQSFGQHAPTDLFARENEKRLRVSTGDEMFIPDDDVFAIEAQKLRNNNRRRNILNIIANSSSNAHAAAALRNATNYGHFANDDTVVTSSVLDAEANIMASFYAREFEDDESTLYSCVCRKSTHSVYSFGHSSNFALGYASPRNQLLQATPKLIEPLLEIDVVPCMDCM